MSLIRAGIYPDSAMGSGDKKPIYIDPYSLLVQKADGMIVRFYCPFTVVAGRDVGSIRKGDMVQVDMVKSDPDGWLVYVIQGKGCWYGNFRILA